MKKSYQKPAVGSAPYHQDINEETLCYELNTYKLSHTLMDNCLKCLASITHSNPYCILHSIHTSIYIEI